MCSTASTSKGNFRLELNPDEETASAASAAAAVAAATATALEVPAPFPTTSNIGLGLRSPPSGLTSGLTSGRTTPCSVSPTSPMTPSSPGSSPQQQVGRFSKATRGIPFDIPPLIDAPKRIESNFEIDCWMIRAANRNRKAAGKQPRPAHGAQLAAAPAQRDL